MSYELRVTLYAIALSLCFFVGWQVGLAQWGWHKWIVAPLAAFLVGGMIRCFWLSP